MFYTSFPTRLAEHNPPAITSTATTASSHSKEGRTPNWDYFFNMSSTGFVLKLYQMVNGAPDDILSWVSNGEAFKISDLSRLEEETLPSYFRHSRFQSLVRQLNFYNFRKVNRERNFWVYQHPLFHRDRPEDLKKLRRRTCPGFGSKKKTRTSILSTSYDDEEEDDEEITRESVMEIGEATPIVSPESIAGAKVSRSPSPSSSSNSVNSEQVKGSARQISLKSVDSEVETIISDAISKSFYRTVSTASFDRPGIPTGSCDDDTFSKLTEEELEEHHSQLYAVAEVSRDLDMICADLTSASFHKRGRGTRSGGANAGTAYVACFGLSKPESHYSKIKCDLLTYDDEDDVIFEDGEEKVSADEKDVSTGRYLEVRAVETAVDLTPPSQDDRIIESLTNACREGRLSNSVSSPIERSISSKVLRFFLATHPQDPHIRAKIIAHLKSYPFVCDEFNVYCKALDRGMSVSEDIRQDWVTFSSNQIRHMMMAVCSYDPVEASVIGGSKLSGIELQAMKRCYDLWF